MYSFWDITWITFGVFAFVVYFILLASIVGDLFRDSRLSGWSKVLWIIFLVWIPYLTAFVYLVVRGRGMGDRQQIAIERRARTETGTTFRDTSTPAAEITRAQTLLDSGSITRPEFDTLKARALA